MEVLLFSQSTTSTKDTYGFKSKHSLHKINELIPFEGMLNLIQIQGHQEQNQKPNSLVIPADKTTNYYKMNTTAYSKLIRRT